MNNKEKKPVYKKVWFWIIIVVVIGAIGAGSSQNGAKVVNSNNANQPSKSQQAEKTEFKVGETIAFDGKEVVIKTLQRNWTSDNQFIKPSDGKEFVKATVTIVNKSSSELSFNTFDWKVEDANGAIEGPSATAFTASDNLGSGDLAVNGKKEGSVIFEVPTGSSVKIHYKPSFWSNKKIVIVP
ncbi:MAG: DUF4352 domain-containing protein [Candidatus Saccharibacteria bacterium]|nr:DUF4352 domain-containing protein [Candidatus Saccharibacteria bacterium]